RGAGERRDAALLGECDPYLGHQHPFEVEADDVHGGSFARWLRARLLLRLWCLPPPLHATLPSGKAGNFLPRGGASGLPALRPTLLAPPSPHHPRSFGPSFPHWSKGAG